MKAFHRWWMVPWMLLILFVKVLNAEGESALSSRLVPSPPSNTSPAKESEIDRLIDAYRQRTSLPKDLLRRRVCKEIASEVEGRQKMAIIEQIKLHKLKQVTRQKRRSHRSHRRRKYRHSSCRSPICVLERIRRSVGSFFRQVTRKRKHPIKRTSPRNVLRGKDS